MDDKVHCQCRKKLRITHQLIADGEGVFPFILIHLRLLVKSYLNKNIRTVTDFSRIHQVRTGLGCFSNDTI